MRFRFHPVTLILLATIPLSGHAGDASLPLKLDRTFKKNRPPSEGAAAFISAQHVEAKKDDQLEANGEVELRQGGQVISAGHLVYGQVSKDVQAAGDVRIEQPGSVVSGPLLKLNLDTYLGEMLQPQYEFSENHARGVAANVQIKGKMNYTFEDATYTTCPAGNDDWLLRMSTLEIDRNTQTGVAYHSRVEFKGVPILYTPWMDFGLNSNRRSGFLGPVFGSTNKGGSEMLLPYYWNIAPNYDATIAPRMIAKRGTQFNNEFRYLTSSFAGVVQYDILSYDRLAGRQRHRTSLKHTQALGAGFGAALNINRVSDDDYFRDLSSQVSGTSQVNLLREGALTYGAGWWNASVRVQRFQTLHPSTLADIPYRRQPQINLNAQQKAASANIAVTGEYADFRHETKVNAQRLVLYPTVSYPLLNDLGYFLTPKLGVHHTEYRMGVNNVSSLPNASRNVPIFSTDSGMVFERNDSFLGNEYVQTLEPRLYYVYIPYRDQGALPNFDTAQAPFNFGQIFTENRFFGNDRVGDANMATAALTSRVIDNEGGTERLRVMVGQRFSFKAPKVALPGTLTDSNNRSDILVGLGGRLTKAWSLDSLYQYNPNQLHTEAYNVMARYKPEAGKLLNLNYRFTRNSIPQLRQADVSAQWPLFGRWQGVGRLNYSLPDKRAVEALAGLEYNQDCWAVRLVAQSFTTAARERSTGVFVQLELNDLVRIGSDPLDALRNSVSGYTKMNGLPSEQPVQGLR